MKPYRFYELHDQEFEQLVTQLCLRLLGIGTIVFTTGRDGGRDGRFNGTAQRFPSEASPLTGKFIIQSKHTSNPSASCSDNDFKQIMKKERPRIKILATNNELEHYLLFTNRRLAGNKEAQLCKDIGRIRNIQTVHVIASNNIQQYLTVDHEIWTDLGFDKNDTPFRINPNDLVAVIQDFHRSMSNGNGQFNSATNFTHVDKKNKNRINKLSKEYYEYIQSNSLPHFGKIKQFLEDPRNEMFRMMYHDAADDLKAKTLTFRQRFGTFDEVLTYICDQIVEGNSTLQGNKRLVRVFLHYMYFDCDLGSHA
jgi:hypothetical protein